MKEFLLNEQQAQLIAQAVGLTQERVAVLDMLRSLPQHQAKAAGYQSDQANQIEKSDEQK